MERANQRNARRHATSWLLFARDIQLFEAGNSECWVARWQANENKFRLVTAETMRQVT